MTVDISCIITLLEA